MRDKWGEYMNYWNYCKQNNLMPTEKGYQIYMENVVITLRNLINN